MFQTVFDLVFSRIARYSSGVLQSDSYDYDIVATELMIVINIINIANNESEET